MGNLHSGHLSLVELAREHAERVVVTMFVNPTQFGEGEDFEEYPRTLKRDTQRLRKLEADALFSPDVDTVYPFGIDMATLRFRAGPDARISAALRDRAISTA